MQKVQEEAETTLGMLAFDAFPRFLKSKFCNAVMDDLKKASNPNEVSKGRATFSIGSVSRGVCQGCGTASPAKRRACGAASIASI